MKDGPCNAPWSVCVCVCMGGGQRPRGGSYGCSRGGTPTGVGTQPGPTRWVHLCLLVPAAPVFRPFPQPPAAQRSRVHRMFGGAGFPFVCTARGGKSQWEPCHRQVWRAVATCVGGEAAVRRVREGCSGASENVPGPGCWWGGARAPSTRGLWAPSIVIFLRAGFGLHSLQGARPSFPFNVNFLHGPQAGHTPTLWCALPSTLGLAAGGWASQQGGGCGHSDSLLSAPCCGPASGPCSGSHSLLGGRWARGATRLFLSWGPSCTPGSFMSTHGLLLLAAWRPL